MRKILSLFMTVMFSVALFAVTETTVYYTASSDVIGTKTVKLNVNLQGDGESWAQYDMTLTALTYNGDPVYTKSFTDLYDGVGVMQFQLYDGETWASQDVAINTWTFATEYNGKMFVHETLAWVAAPEADGGEAVQMYLWNGIGVTTAAAATEEGGAAEAVQADGNNIVAGASQKGNWCLKANKGFSSGAYYLGIAMTNGVNAGDTVKIAYFRTSASSTYVLGMDFSADKASATTDYQILSQGDPQVLSSNGTPVDSIFIIPEGVANAKYMRIYRNSGSTGLWVAKVQVIKKAAAPEPPANFYITGSAYLVGEEKQWNPAAIAVTENAYTFENLPAGDYKLKLTLEGDWNTAIGFGAMTDTTAGLYTDADANINFTLSAPANITVNFIKGEQGITTFTVTGSNFASPVVKLMGIDADWSTGVLLEDAADHKTASKTLTLAATYQDFKLVVVTDWYGWGYEPGNQYEIKRDYNFIDILVSKDEPNALKLNADAAGDYTFTYNYVTRKLTVDFPAAPVEMKDLELVVAEESAWDAEGEKLAVWAWVDGNEGAWYATAVENEKLMAHIPAVCDKVIVARFEEDEELIWTKALAQTSNLTFDKCAKVYLSDNGAQFCDWAPEPEPVEVIFTVIVPEGTDSVFIAGTFNGWTTFEKMNAVEGQENKYTITKTIVDVEGLEYKYTSGRSWDYVEIIEGGENRTWTELDVVAAWKAVPQPAFEHHDFFITGNAALVGEELAWNPNAIPVDGNSYVLHLGAGTYEMKIVLDSCGASNCQQWFGCERLSDEQVEGVACSKVGNIEFALAGEEDVTVTVDLTDTIITLTGNFYNIQMVDIRLVLSPEWAMDNAQFAAVTWRDGQEMENDGVFTDWFVGTGDTVVGQIPEDATQIAFARFAPEVVKPSMNPEDPYFWNHSDKLIIEPSMIYTITGGDVPGRNFSPGYWGERPAFIADGYFLLGTFNEWTPSAAYEFSTPDNDGQRKVTVALEENDQLKVAEYYRGYRIAWFPEGNDNNYVVDEKHAGTAQDVYFRADYSGDGAWHYGCIYVVDNGATAIDNTAIDAKAEKMLRNGMILIIKGDKTYNVMGQIVK